LAGKASTLALRRSVEPVDTFERREVGLDRGDAPAFSPQHVGGVRDFWFVGGDEKVEPFFWRRPSQVPARSR
jgi:hypothetical protein